MSGMVLAAGELWKSATFWAAVAAVATAATVFVTPVVTQWVTAPVRRLVYGIRSQAPLVTAPVGMHDALEVRHHGQVVADPHVVEVLLEGRGRRDISRNAFDNGAPLRLDLGARIVELLQTTHDSAPSMRTLPVAVDGTAVTVGPGLIGRRQKTTFTVLVEGEPTLDCDAPLPDVSVRPHIPDEPSVASLMVTVVSWVSVMAAGLGAIWAAVESSREAVRPTAVTVGVVAGMLAGAASVGVGMMMGAAVTAAPVAVMRAVDRWRRRQGPHL